MLLIILYYLGLVEQVRDGTTLRIRLFMPEGEHQMVTIALAGVRSTRVSSKPGEPSEQWAEEVRHTEGFTRILSQSSLINVGQILYRVALAPKTSTGPNPFLAHLYRDAFPSCCQLYRFYICHHLHWFRSVRFVSTRKADADAYIVLHPAGNVAEHLVAAGLARVVDWHAGMLSGSGGLERLRTAEKSAKERRACLYANPPTITALRTSSATPMAKSFDATVIRVWSGDQISVIEKDSRKEHRVQLSSTRGPKYPFLSSVQRPILICPPSWQTI